MTRYQRVLVEDSFPAQILVLTGSAIIYFMPSISLKIIGIPIVVFLVFVLQKTINPAWFSRNISGLAFISASIFMILSFNILLSCVKDFISFWIFLWVFIFSVLLCFVDWLSEVKGV